jgi:hypothetical protein
MTKPLIEDVFIRCDPVVVFDLLADVRNETRWSRGVSSAEMRSDGPVADGSTFVTVYRGMENDITLVEFDRPERLVVVGTNDRMDIDTSYAFTAQGGGTRVVVTTEVRPKGVLSVLSPLLPPFLRRELAAKYTNVKQACEAPPDPS